MKKSKFGNLNFDSVETLSREELKKVKGGYGWQDALTNAGQINQYVVNCVCGSTTFQSPPVNWERCCNGTAAAFVCQQNAPSTCYDLRDVGATSTC